MSSCAQGLVGMAQAGGRHQGGQQACESRDIQCHNVNVRALRVGKEGEEGIHRQTEDGAERSRAVARAQILVSFYRATHLFRKLIGPPLGILALISDK